MVYQSLPIQLAIGNGVGMGLGTYGIVEQTHWHKAVVDAFAVVETPSTVVVDRVVAEGVEERQEPSPSKEAVLEVDSVPEGSIL